MPRRKNLSKSILASADGWSTIPGRGRPTLHLTSTPSRSPSPPPTDAELSRLGSALSRARETVRGIAQLEELWEAVRAVGKEGKGVERVYVLGLGSLVGNGAGSSILQLAVVEEVLVLLSAAAAASSAATTATAAATVETAAAAASPPPKIQTIFRDPAFTRTDHAFLLQRQYITESPDLPLAPTDSSILIAPHLEFSVVRDVLKTGWNPVLLLANDLKRFLDLRVGDVNEWSVFLRFFEEERGGYKHKRLEVGGKENEAVQRAFSDLAVFWRVPPAAVVEEEE